MRPDVRVSASATNARLKLEGGAGSIPRPLSGIQRTCAALIAVAAALGCGDREPTGADAAVAWDAPPASVDAGGAGPGPAQCGTLGSPCSEPVDCGDGQICTPSNGGAFCATDRPNCGGITGATCDDPAAPRCYYLRGSDLGVCVSAVELACICRGSPTSVEGCP